MSLPAYSCWALVLLIARVYTYALLEKVTPVQYWLKWKLVYYACDSFCRQLIKQPAVARCLLEILRDACSFRRWFGWLVVEPVCWLSWAHGNFYRGRARCLPPVWAGHWSFTTLVFAALEREEVLWGYGDELCWALRGTLISNTSIYQDISGAKSTLVFLAHTLLAVIYKAAFS